MKYKLQNPTNNKWLAKYNKLIQKYKDNVKGNGLSLHHIKPRCKYPNLSQNPRNIVYLPLKEHWNAHYYLWKASWKYALEFWFCYVYFRKHKHWKLSDEEEIQLKLDCAKCRKIKK